MADRVGHAPDNGGRGEVAHVKHTRTCPGRSTEVINPECSFPARLLDVTYTGLPIGGGPQPSFFECLIISEPVHITVFMVLVGYAKDIDYCVCV